MVSPKINYLLGCLACVGREEGRSFAGLLKLPPPSQVPVLPALAREGDWEEIRDACDRRLPEDFGEMVYLHLRTVAALRADQPDLEEAYASQAAMVSSFLRAYDSCGRWATPILEVSLTNLRSMAARADRARAAAGLKPEKLSDMTRLLNKAFQLCQTDRSSWETSRRSASLFVANSLFKVYFRLKQHRLCHTLIKAISNDFPSFHLFPASDRVAFRYYVGLLAFYEEDFAKAEKELSEALAHCHRGALKNKKQILKYLLPVKLLRGQYGAQRVVANLGMPGYREVQEAVRRGDVGAFSSTLAAHTPLFVSQGVYLIFERIKLLAYRSLFRKVFLILGKNTKLPLEAFRVALKVAGEDMEVAEVECLLSILIDKSCIKGYISHEKSFLVLSQASPFPRLEGFI